jgi:hypothetical protein
MLQLAPGGTLGRSDIDSRVARSALIQLLASMSLS